MAEREELLQELQRLADELGESPRAVDMRESGEYYPRDYQDEFGTWNEALATAELDLNQQRATNKTEEDFINDLQKVADKVGRTPRLTDVDQQGKWNKTTYKKRITDGESEGKWNEVLKKAGFKPYYEIRETIEKTCPECGDVFEVKEYNADIRFCSRQCFHEWHSVAISGEANPSYNSKTVECEHCREPTTKKVSRIEKREHQFCSHNCYAEWISENKTGKDAFRYQGGRAEYGPGFNQEKKEKVRNRDNYRCQVCGITQIEHLKQEGRKLSVHHIIPAKKFDDPDKRNDMDNLVTLCRKDHQRWEGIPLKPQLNY